MKTWTGCLLLTFAALAGYQGYRDPAFIAAFFGLAFLFSGNGHASVGIDIGDFDGCGGGCGGD